MNNDSIFASVTPSLRQIEFQKTAFYAFVHFSVNTFTDREWGDGTESPDLFNPVNFDARQWVNAIKSAGMKGLILTCKHHDGFCLWHSRLTDYTVERSPFGRDIVRETANACKEGGIRFGVYLSPWDRNCPLYGTGKAYDDFFIGQLTELLTDYGELFTVWFDGACGEGKEGRKQYYDWERYYAVIRKLQPKACINVCGPDIRWCGNEAGYTRDAEWSVVPARTRDTEIVASNSQKTASGAFRLRQISACDKDLGSRRMLADESELVWYPAEVSTSIRPGWFWHKSENDKVRPLTELQDIYYRSVGANATFLLNIPPTDSGLFHENDVKRLGEIGAHLKKVFAVNLAIDADIVYAGESIRNDVLQDGYDRYFIAKAGTNRAEIEITWRMPVDIGNIVLKENICMSQRIESFTVEIEEGGCLTKIYDGTVVGYQRIIRLGGVKTDRLRIHITDARTEPTLSFIGIYQYAE